MGDRLKQLLELRRSALTGNVAALVGALISLTLATLMVARIGGPAAVGDYALLRVMPWLLAVVVSGGLAAATPWFLAGPTRDDPRVKPTVLAMAVASAAVSVLLWMAASPFLREAFFKDLGTAVVAWAGLKTVSRLFVITAKASSQGTNDLSGTNHAIFLEELLFIPGYAGALVVGAHGGGAVVAGLIVADVLTGAVAWRRLVARRYFEGMGRPSLALAKDIYKFGLRGQVGSLMYLVNLRLDFMIVDLIAGPAILGIYAVASKFAELVRLLPISFEWVLYPKFAGQTPAAAWARAAWVIPRAAAATALGAIPLAVLAQPVIPLFYGRAFAGAVQPAHLLLVGLSIEGASGVITAYLFGRGRPGLNSLATFGGVMVTVGLDLLLIPRFSLIGASIASTAAYLTTTTLLGLCFLLLRPKPTEAVIEVGEAIQPGRIRRTLDIGVAVVALVVMAPLIFIAWAGARISTGASGVYRQVRVGEGGSAFTMLKFRSMRPSGEGPEITVSGDPRVTRFGRLLRSTSIDELPQLLNILRGDMTLVGARPETVALARRYPKDLQDVFRYRPGLTGPAQLYLRTSSRLSGEEDVESSYLSTQVPQRVRLDLEYLTDPTAAKTLFVIGRTAAYIATSALQVGSGSGTGYQLDPGAGHAHPDPWRLLAEPTAERFELPGTGSARAELARQMRQLPPGTDLVLCATAFAARRRVRRFAREAGLVIHREYVGIPKAGAPTFYVSDSPMALHYFFTKVSALPVGGAAASAVLAAAKQVARVAFPSTLIGALAPTRIVVGRTGAGAAVIASPDTSRKPSLLDMPDKDAIVLALSKDPNAKLTVLLIPRGERVPTLAVKVPTTDASVTNIEAERNVLMELRRSLPASILATIPEVLDLPIQSERPLLVAAGLRGSPMSTRYHGWRHVATPAAVDRDFAMAEAWLSRLQAATAGSPAPINMAGHVSEALRERFRDDPSVDLILGRLGVAHARLSRSRTPRTAVHGDFWFGNLLVDREEISGVIDWECGSTSGEPLRDIVRFALTYALYLDRHSPAGGRVAGHDGLRTGTWGSGIEFAITGAGWFPELFRSFVGRGLSRLGADPLAWRDASLAGLAEVAATADHDAFARLHWDLFARLSGVTTVEWGTRSPGLTPVLAAGQAVSSDG